jgi:hypothetical protein
MAVCGSFNLRGQLYCKAGSRGQSVQAGPCHKHQSAGALVSQGMAFAGPWPEEMVPETSKSRGSGAVDWTLSQGWVWDAVGTSRLLTRLRGPHEGCGLSGKGGAGCSDGRSVLGMFGRGTGDSSSGSLAEQTWSASGL